MKGLLVQIMGMDCTNGGVTSGKRNAIVGVPDSGPFESTQDTPGLVFIEDTGVTGFLNVHKRTRERDLQIVCVKAVPEGTGNGGMFGGHFVWTSDSRFPYSSPVPVFDRFETREEQRLYGD